MIMMMNKTKPHVLHLLLVLSCTWVLTVSATSDAYPSVSDCGVVDEVVVPVRREVHGEGKIFDISHRYREDMPSFQSDDGLGQFLWLRLSMKNGSIVNVSELKFSTHSGTHVDAPGHVFDHYYDAGFDVDSLDLEVLNEFSVKSVVSSCFASLSAMAWPFIVRMCYVSVVHYTVRRLHLRPSPLCASLFASLVLTNSCDDEKPRPQILCLTPFLLAIKFSHSDQRRRQLAGIVAELAGTMAENGVAIPSNENDAPTSVSDASNSSTFDNEDYISSNEEIVIDEEENEQKLEIEMIEEKKHEINKILDENEIILEPKEDLRSFHLDRKTVEIMLTKQGGFDLGWEVGPKTKLKQFVDQYDEALKSKVEKENTEDFISLTSRVPCITHYAIEKQFQDSYTNSKFKEVQDEIRRKMYCHPSLLKQEGAISTYQVVDEIEIDDDTKEVTFHVYFNEDELENSQVAQEIEVDAGEISLPTLSTPQEDHEMGTQERRNVQAQQHGHQFKDQDADKFRVDYLNVATYFDAIPAHHAFLEAREIIIVEAVKLDHYIQAGIYSLHCLPLRLPTSDGSPARCILIK
uniref:Uncharacterized protein n=1 Tax=Quercus lobata TaxID=97700 RepID=A0A7N2MY89_QUELO